MNENKNYFDNRVILYHGDSRDVLKTLPDNSIDALVSDPPYSLQSIVKRFGNVKTDDETQTSDKLKNRSDPYARTAAGFANYKWDTGETAFNPEFWAEVLRVMKPGAYLLAMGGTRTYHRLVCAIEDAGFSIYDTISYMYGSGMPKSHNIMKDIDRLMGKSGKRGKVKPGHEEFLGTGNTGFSGGLKGFDRPWKHDKERAENYHYEYEPGSEEAQKYKGSGTGLKPAQELICLAQKPLSEKTIAKNILKWGTGYLNIDACRIEIDENIDDPRLGGNGSWSTDKAAKRVYHGGYAGEDVFSSPLGRWPANVISDGSDEVASLFPKTKSGKLLPHHQVKGKGLNNSNTFEIRNRTGEEHSTFGDSGSAARFFYTTKPKPKDKIYRCLKCETRFMGKPTCGCTDDNGKQAEYVGHPTMKPIDLMQYLCRLVTPEGGTILEPFAGSGTTGIAALDEGFNVVMIEREEEYIKDIEFRLDNYKFPKKINKKFTDMLK